MGGGGIVAIFDDKNGVLKYKLYGLFSDGIAAVFGDKNYGLKYNLYGFYR